jgi:putative transposase
MYEGTKCACIEAIRQDLNAAFKNFFAGRAEYPKFHKKGVHDSFHLSNDQVRLYIYNIESPKQKRYKLKLPNLPQPIKMAEGTRFTGRFIGATISRRADQWFVSFSTEVELPEPTPALKNQEVGVDLGVITLATLSDGTKIEGPKSLEHYEKKLRRLRKSLSRKKGAEKGEKKSNNYKKARTKLARLYLRIHNIRNDSSHKLTTTLTKEFSTICIEDLNVSGMLKNRRLAGSIQDRSFYEIRRQLTYKSEMRGRNLVIADRWFPSSKTCSSCGSKNENLKSTDREWICPSCGVFHDRDINAAKNLRNYALKQA